MPVVGLGKENIAQESRIIIQQCLKLDGVGAKKNCLRTGCV